MSTQQDERLTDESKWNFALALRVSFTEAATLELIHRLAIELSQRLQNELDVDPDEASIGLVNRGSKFAPLPPFPVLDMTFAQSRIDVATQTVGLVKTFFAGSPIDHRAEWSAIITHENATIDTGIAVTHINETAIARQIFLKTRGDIQIDREALSDIVHYHLLCRTNGDPALHLTDIYYIAKQEGLLVANRIPSLVPSETAYAKGIYVRELNQDDIVDHHIFLHYLMQLIKLPSNDMGEVDTIKDTEDQLKMLIADIWQEHSPTVGGAIQVCERPAEKDIEVTITLDGTPIADWSRSYDYSAFGPVGVDESHEMHFSLIPPNNQSAALLTLAIRHAEIHLLGTPFNHECKRWEKLVHRIAEQISAKAHLLPKWYSLELDDRGPISTDGQD